MNLASDSDLDKIRDRIDIVELISGRTRLKKGGARYKGLCPFHNEKTPSFTVDPERKLWHCFGCGAGGDMFTFVMQSENLEFPDAVRLLAEKAGVDLEPFNAAAGERKQGDRRRLQRINSLAARYFEKVLQSEKMGAPYRAYIQERALPDELVQEYRLGAAPDSWDGLIRAFGKKDVTPEELVRAGLAVNKEGRIYNRFRNRLIFPLTNIVGDIIGFAGRAMGDAMPKYLNSPETPLFDKSRVVYNLDRAKKQVQDDALILTEGYMDVLGLAGAGIRNAVASMGTSLTPAQVDALRRYCTRVYLAYDSDIAGDNAAMRGIEILIERGLDIRVVTMPQGQDPDDIVRTGGAEAFYRLLDSAKGYFEYFLGKSMEKHGAEDPRALRDIILELTPLIRKSNNPVLQDAQRNKMAATLNLEEQRVTMIMGQSREPGSRKPDKEAEFAVRALSGAAVVEKKVMECLFSDAAGAAKILDRLDASYFSDKKMKTLFRYCKDYQGKNEGLRPDDFLNDTHPQNIVNLISGISLTPQEQETDRDRFTAALLDKFVDDVKKRRLTQLKKQILEAENRGDRDTVTRLAMEMTQVKKEII